MDATWDVKENERVGLVGKTQGQLGLVQRAGSIAARAIAGYAIAVQHIRVVPLGWCWCIVIVISPDPLALLGFD